MAEPAYSVRDGDVIAAGHDVELDELRAMRDNTGQFLVDLEQRERARTGIGNLRVEYNRVHGFYIEVSHGQSAKVPDDYRRRQTLKNAERYITPELKSFEDRALSARERALSREKALYEQLLDSLASRGRSDSDRCRRRLPRSTHSGRLRSMRASARWIEPELVERPGLEIRGGRHAVVESELESYVPNDCVLHPARRLLVITGPNMGGKSTYMRSVALIALLAYAGSYVPASGARLGPIDRILTRIGAADDLARGRSTFMVEMTEAAAILHGASETSLVLMDEIGRGTSTFDGMALAAAIARELVEKNRCLTLFATHYFELTQLAEQHAEVANVHVAAAEANGKVVFLHEVRAGPASQSYGLAVAQLAGVPAAGRAPRARTAAATGRARARRETAARFVRSLDRGARRFCRKATHRCASGCASSTSTRCRRATRMRCCQSCSDSRTTTPQNELVARRRFAGHRQEAGHLHLIGLGQVLRRRRADVDHADIETQCETRQRMIAVEHRHAVGDISDREKTAVLAVGPGGLDAHADRNLRAELIRRRQHHELRVVVAECVLGFELQAQSIAGRMADEGFLDARKDVLVTVQVLQRTVRSLQQLALRVIHRDVETDEHSIGDFHACPLAPCP